MSYLPRMSDTYKEPRSASDDGELERSESTLSHNILKPASAILNEKTVNSQTALKHYRYLPHPPPTLPGPSVLDEALENESLMEKYRSKRDSAIQSNTEVDANQENVDHNNSLTSNLDDSEEDKDVYKLTDNTQSSTKRSVSSRKGHKSSKSIHKKKSSTKSLVYKKQSSKKLDHVTVNTCLVGLDRAKDFSVALNERKDSDELADLLYRNDSTSHKTSSFLNVSRKSSNSISTSIKQTLLEVERLKSRPKEYKNRSVQCTIFGSSEKIFVIPSIIHTLLQALAFLLHELNREDAMAQGSTDRKRLMPQIQLILGDLCSQNYEERFCFDTTYSDSKRVEKVLWDLQKYIKDVYGDKAEQGDKIEDFKKFFLELKKKEVELAILEEQVKENEFPYMNELEIKESDFKTPEVTLQNKRLESEQLLAEIEFSSRELRNFQKTLAESDWEIKLKQDQVAEMKKMRSSKSKTEVSGKKSSIQRLSTETLSKGLKTKDSTDRGSRKKT